MRENVEQLSESCCVTAVDEFLESDIFDEVC